MAWCKVGENRFYCWLISLRCLQCMFPWTNVASNSMSVHLISSIHLFAFLLSSERSKLVDLSLEMCQNVTVYVTWLHLWFNFSLRVPPYSALTLYCADRPKPPNPSYVQTVQNRPVKSQLVGLSFTANISFFYTNQPAETADLSSM